MKFKSLFAVALFAALTVGLTSCPCPCPGPDPDPKPEEGTWIVVDEEGNEIAHNSKIYVTEYDEIIDCFAWDAAIKNDTKKDVAITLTEVRHFDATLYTTQFCVAGGNCQSGNGQDRQVWNFEAERESTQGFYTHVAVPEAQKSESANLEVEYIFSDGEKEVAILVTYQYTAPEQPEEPEVPEQPEEPGEDQD